MTLSNQCLTLPPDHPLAKEMYDLQCSQATVMGVFIPGHPNFGLMAQSDGERALELINEAITFLIGHYRAERGGDASCTVALTYDPVTRFPVVNDRPSDGSPCWHEQPSTKMRTN